MKRKTFILQLSALPLVAGTLAPGRSLASEPKPTGASAGAKDAAAVTEDLFTGDFPPLVYGGTPAEAEPVFQDVVEKVFRDGDGMLRSGVNGPTMKPIRLEDVKDRPNAVGTFAQHSSIPPEAKPVWMTYENSGQCSGIYLEALTAKVQVTRHAPSHRAAQQTIAAVRTLRDNAATMKHPLGGEGRGWFPKPYLGIKNVKGMFECSADQYADLTLGLHTYYHALADDGEKKQIKDLVLSFADWWYEHAYAGVYFGQAIWWNRLPWHPMAVGYFLFLNAWANELEPAPRYREAFDAWLKLKPALKAPEKPIWLCMHGLSLNLFERLIVVRPDLSAIWREAAEYQAPLLVRSVKGEAGDRENIQGFAANYLTTAHRLLPNAGYDQLARKALASGMQRGDLYALKRGRRLADLDPRLAGDDYRNQYWCENHVHWLAGYWRLQIPGPLGR